MSVTVDQSGEQRLAASVIDVGVWIRGKDLVRWSDRRDLVANHRESDVILDRVSIDDGCIPEHDGPGCGRLRPEL